MEKSLFRFPDPGFLGFLLQQTFLSGRHFASSSSWYVQHTELYDSMVVNLLRKLLMLGRIVHIGPKIVDCVARATSLLNPQPSISCKRGRELHSKLHGKSSRFLISIPRDHLCRLDFSLHTLPCAAHCPHRFGRAEACLPLPESPQMARSNLYTQPNYHTMALLCHRRQAHPR